MNREGLHDFREEIDVNIKKAERDLKTGSDANGFPVYRRELEIAHQKLQEAKMWVGKCLEQLGSELPPEFRDESKPDTDVKK